MSRASRAWEALQERIQQTAETVTRSARIDIVSGGVDEIDPPEDLDEFADQAKTTGPVRKNLRQFVNDVWEPGYDVDAESDATEAYFMGGESAPEGTPEGGFMENAGIIAGQRRQDFYQFGKLTTWQRWVRGTILVEKLKQDIDDPESPITGFYHIRPETVYPQVENNTNILLPPEQDELPEDIDPQDVETTRRGEVAAYIQFDDESILGIRRNGFDDRQQIPLSQNDVMKQVLDPDIGDDAGLADTQGVFGTSIIEGISEDITEYKQIKRDRSEAINRKAYGIYTAQFTPEVIDLGDRKEVIEWDDASIQDTEAELNNMDAGDVLTSDANIDLEKYESEVPELDDTIRQYINIILAPLPAPKYMVGFAEGINRDVTEEQREGYLDLVSEERRYQEKKWTPVLREVAERQGLDPTGVELKIQPETEENPVKSLSTEEIERMNTYVGALNAAAGPQAGPTALVSREELLEVLDFPTEDMDNPEDMAEELSRDADTEEAFKDIFGVESLDTRYSEGDVVQTPQGIGVISGVFTSNPTEDVDASENSPAYAVALKDARIGSEFYKASQLSESELPDTGLDNPTEDIEAMADVFSATGAKYEALDWTMPESWRESDVPARVILLDAWSSMGGQFDCGGACCMGDLRDEELCASMKDEVLGTEAWRGWGD